MAIRSALPFVVLLSISCQTEADRRREKDEYARNSAMSDAAMRIEILSSSQVTRPYRIVGVASQQDIDPNKAIVRMQIQAFGLGGDALLDLEERSRDGSKTIAAPIAGTVFVRSRPTSEASTWTARVIAWIDEPATTPAPPAVKPQ
jgi:hypothetical protein